MIINNDNRDEVYFCFQSRIKEGWDILSKSPSPINIEIEYEESQQDEKLYKRVINLSSEDDILI